MWGLASYFWSLQVFWEKGGLANSATFCVPSYPQNFVLEDSDTSIAREAENPGLETISDSDL